jgi:hypothetical protein
LKNTSTFIEKGNKRISKVQGKSNVVYISSYKKRNQVKPYTKTDDDWYNIIRANDGDRKVSFKAARLVSKLMLELHKSNNRPVYKDNYWFSKIVNVYSRMQNLRLRNQINHIFNFTFHKIIIVDRALLKDVYEISFTENAHKILNFEDIKIDKEDDKINAPDMASNKLNENNKNVTIPQQKCYAYIDNKALVKEEPKVHSFTNADNEKLKIKNPESQSLEKSSLSDDFLTSPNPPEPITNEDNEMKAQIIQLKPERNMQQELHEAIYKAFGTGIAGELITRCQFISEPNRVGIKVGQGITLSETDKEKLRTCIRAIYGENINIFSLNKEDDLQPKIETPNGIWREIKRSFISDYGKESYTAWFCGVTVEVIEKNKTITLTALNSHLIRDIQRKYFDYLEKVANSLGYQISLNVK